AQPFIMGVCGAGRTEFDGRVGFMVGNIVKRFCTMAWTVTALGAVAWYLQRGVDLSTIRASHVYGDVARAFLPGFLPGLLGVFLASLLASVMSSCDAFMISSSGLFTENIYKPARPGLSESHYLFVGRVAGLGVVAGGLFFAFWVETVLDALDIWFKIAPMMGIAFWMGLLWRRATPAGAWASTLAGFGLWRLTSLPQVADAVGEWPIALDWRVVQVTPGGSLEFYEPWVIVIYTVGALVAGVIASLVTRPVPRERLDRFYALTRTPVAPGEIVASPCTLPVGMEPASRKMWCTAWGLEIPRPSNTSLAGFAAGWVAVFALIGGFMWLIGR
ncbi:MAG: hypothetical protein KDA61_20360, partial [Planctomycetales bacterium]|nr:hypothetical protein [Planctomycetales bacterium]